MPPPSAIPPLPTNFNGAVGLTPDPESVRPIRSTATSTRGPIMDVGVMNGNEPAPTMAIDEDDEFFLTLTNVGMIMRPDLFEQHTVHFHGYPNASAFYDGVPDASVAINIGGSFTYYYLAPDAGHLHVALPHHPARAPGDGHGRPDLRAAAAEPGAGRCTACMPGCRPSRPILRTPTAATTFCARRPLPQPTMAQPMRTTRAAQPTLYAYNDGDGSTAYDVEYPIQIHGFDPNFHFVGMTFNPEALHRHEGQVLPAERPQLPGHDQPGARCRPSRPMARCTISQPLPTLINIPAGGRALLRISDLDVTEMQTLASLGIPMHVVGLQRQAAA